MSEKKQFDLVVLGAGPGGYVAAIKAAQLGKSVALIEKDALGGTCLNVGCIPTKTLLSNASTLEKIKMSEKFGIHVENISFDYRKMKERKDSVIEGIRKSLERLLNTNKITVLSGMGEFTSPFEIKVKGKDACLIEAKKIIIATGSTPLDIPSFPCDHETILNSTSILELTKLPTTLAIIGGGYIGCEFASLFAAFGVKVTILEALDSIIALQGKAMGEALTKTFKQKGIDVRTNVVVERIEKTSDGAKVYLKEGSSIDAEKVLVAVGRQVCSSGFGLEKTGIALGSKGEITVNNKMETTVAGIYAIGDVTGKFLLAHVASHQAIIAAQQACGFEGEIHYDAVPAVIFTEPEIATVGMTLEQAEKRGFNASVGKFPFQALGKAVASNATDGFTEIIIDKKSGRILGAHVMGHEASSLIAEMALAIANELTAASIAETIHAHPTLPEAWLEAALIANETPIHFPPKIKR